MTEGGGGILVDELLAVVIFPDNSLSQINMGNIINVN